MKQMMIFLAVLIFALPVRAFDQSHAAWNALLQKHVHLIDHGVASQADYRGFQQDRAALDGYTRSLSAVSADSFAGFTPAQRMAFLINAYNAYTVELILSRYPDLHSIKDLGGLFSSPWKKDFFTLLGKTGNLDQIESRLRAPGVFDDPRIHFAINCASIGCPMLREEAYVGDRLDAQLDDAMRRFLSDRTRNRYDAGKDRLEVSKIFDWYARDFSAGHHGFDSVAETLAMAADRLADTPAARERIRSGKLPIHFLDYNWGLNDVAR